MKDPNLYDDLYRRQRAPHRSSLLSIAALAIWLSTGAAPAAPCLQTTDSTQQKASSSTGQIDRLTDRLRRHNGVRRSLPLAAGEKISLSTKDADLAEVLRAFARLADLNLILQPGITGTVTVELRDVAWEHALTVILRTHGLSAEVDGSVWAVRSFGRSHP